MFAAANFARPRLAPAPPANEKQNLDGVIVLLSQGPQSKVSGERRHRPIAMRLLRRACARILTSARIYQATGHWRAINPGVTGSMTVTCGVSDAQVRAVRGPDWSDSQADSAGSIPVTRSTKVPAQGMPRW